MSTRVRLPADGSQTKQAIDSIILSDVRFHEFKKLCPLLLQLPPSMTLTSQRWSTSLHSGAKYLVEWVGAGSPIGEEQAKADSLKDTSQGADSDGIEWTLLCEDLRDELRVVSFNLGQYNVDNQREHVRLGQSWP